MKTITTLFTLLLISFSTYSQVEPEVETIATVETAFGSIWINEVKSEEEEYTVLVVQPTIETYVALKTVNTAKMRTALKEIVAMKERETIRLDYVEITSDESIIKFFSTYHGIDHFDVKRSDLKKLIPQIE